MATKDFRKRETKKPKKDARKPAIESILPTPVQPVEVEVVGKKKRKKEVWEAESS